MATKYGPRKKHNAGTVRKSTNNLGGSRTRSTTTTKFGNVTKSRSVNRDGTIRQTTTHKAPSGFITRSVQTVGSKPSKPKTPKFIKAKPYKPPKNKGVSGTRTRSTSGRRGRSKGGDGGGEILVLLFFGIIFGVFWLAWKLLVVMFQAAEQMIQKPESEDLDKMVWYYTKVFFMFLIYIWLAALFVYFIGKMFL